MLKGEIVTQKEVDLLKQFKESIKDVEVDDWLKSDYTLIKFLRARQHNLQASEKMWRESMEWRKSYGTDEIYKRYCAMSNGTMEPTPEFKLLKKFYSCSLVGADKTGSPVAWDRIGLSDLGGIVDEIGIHNLTSWMVALSEEAVANYRYVSETNPEGRIFLGGNVIADLRGLGISHLGVVGKYAKVAGILEANYPERVKTVFLLNPPWVFGKIFALIKPMLNEGTQVKMRVLTSNVMETLEERIDLDNIPEHAGGKLPWPENNKIGTVPKGVLYSEFGKPAKVPASNWYGESLDKHIAPEVTTPPPFCMNKSSAELYYKYENDRDYGRLDGFGTSPSPNFMMPTTIASVEASLTQNPSHISPQFLVSQTS